MANGIPSGYINYKQSGIYIENDPNKLRAMTYGNGTQTINAYDPLTNQFTDLTLDQLADVSYARAVFQQRQETEKENIARAQAIQKEAPAMTAEAIAKSGSIGIVEQPRSSQYEEKQWVVSTPDGKTEVLSTEEVITKKGIEPTQGVYTNTVYENDVPIRKASVEHATQTIEFQRPAAFAGSSPKEIDAKLNKEITEYSALEPTSLPYNYTEKGYILPQKTTKVVIEAPSPYTQKEKLLMSAKPETKPTTKLTTETKYVPVESLESFAMTKAGVFEPTFAEQMGLSYQGSSQGQDRYGVSIKGQDYTLMGISSESPIQDVFYWKTPSGEITTSRGQKIVTAKMQAETFAEEIEKEAGVLTKTIKAGTTPDIPSGYAAISRFGTGTSVDDYIVLQEIPKKEYPKEGMIHEQILFGASDLGEKSNKLVGTNKFTYTKTPLDTVINFGADVAKVVPSKIAGAFLGIGATAIGFVETQPIIAKATGKSVADTDLIFPVSPTYTYMMAGAVVGTGIKAASDVAMVAEGLRTYISPTAYTTPTGELNIYQKALGAVKTPTMKDVPTIKATRDEILDMAYKSGVDLAATGITIYATMKGIQKLQQGVYDVAYKPAKVEAQLSDAYQRQISSKIVGDKQVVTSKVFSKGKIYTKSKLGTTVETKDVSALTTSKAVIGKKTDLQLEVTFKDATMKDISEIKLVADKTKFIITDKGLVPEYAGIKPTVEVLNTPLIKTYSFSNIDIVAGKTGELANFLKKAGASDATLQQVINVGKGTAIQNIDTSLVSIGDKLYLVKSGGAGIGFKQLFEQTYSNEIVGKVSKPISIVELKFDPKQSKVVYEPVTTDVITRSIIQEAPKGTKNIGFLPESDVLLKKFEQTGVISTPTTSIPFYEVVSYLKKSSSGKTLPITLDSAVTIDSASGTSQLGAVQSSAAAVATSVYISGIKGATMSGSMASYVLPTAVVKASQETTQITKTPYETMVVSTTMTKPTPPHSEYKSIQKVISTSNIKTSKEGKIAIPLVNLEKEVESYQVIQKAGKGVEKQITQPKISVIVAPKQQQEIIQIPITKPDEFTGIKTVTPPAPVEIQTPKADQIITPIQIITQIEKPEQTWDTPSYTPPPPDIGDDEHIIPPPPRDKNKYGAFDDYPFFAKKKGKKLKRRKSPSLTALIFPQIYKKMKYPKVPTGAEIRPTKYKLPSIDRQGMNITKLEKKPKKTKSVKKNRFKYN